MHETWAFIDEYGNPNLAVEVDGVSQYFIVTAVVVKAADLPALRTQLDDVRKRIFQTGEMKASGLSKNRDRWVKTLDALAGLPFRLYALVVDKRELDRTGGLQFKHSFYKNLCGKAYGALLRSLPKLHLRADEYGRESFMESFTTYVQKRHQPDLFEKGTFDFVNSRDEVVVQLADLCSGLLARIYDPQMALERPEELVSVLASQILLIEEWPPRFRLRSTDPDGASNHPDARIEALAFGRAQEFIDRHRESAEQEQRCRVALLERLILEQRFSGNALSTGYLMDYLRDRGLEPGDETWVRRVLVAYLRDRGLVITSSSTGYKLPRSRADMHAFAMHADSVCVPMLRRVASARDAVRLATAGDVDIFDDEALQDVKRMQEALAAGESQ